MYFKFLLHVCLTPTLSRLIGQRKLREPKSVRAIVVAISGTISKISTDFLPNVPRKSRTEYCRNFEIFYVHCTCTFVVHREQNPAIPSLKYQKNPRRFVVHHTNVFSHTNMFSSQLKIMTARTKCNQCANSDKSQLRKALQ